VIRLLRDIAAVPKTRVLILSGRDRKTLGAWLSELPIDLASEHGAWVLEPANASRPGPRNWIASPLQDGVASAPWKQPVLAMLREASLMLPGSLVEEKTASLAFHYRRSRSIMEQSPDVVDDAVRGLRASLAQLTSGMPCRVLDAKEALEVRALAVNKGALLRCVVAGTDTDFVLVVGDDETDEDAFAEIMACGCPDTKKARTAVTVRVGHVLSRARWNVADVPAVHSLLWSLISPAEQ
jgi:trehalose 6-phosphate synthase/phosphatase